MEYAKKSLSFLSSSSISRCVSASASVTSHLLNSGPHQRPFRVCNWDRSLKKGIMAEGLQDLLDKVQESLHTTSSVSLLLEEDGTFIETEEFFQTVLDNTLFMVIEKGQKWTPPENVGFHLGFRNKLRRRKDVARITFDLYKENPQDFIGCLNVKVTLYGSYSLSCDVQCMGAKKIMREALRLTMFTMQATGHILLGTSSYVQQLLDEEEQQAAGKPFHLLE
ncbi:cell death activator CIDE-3 [Pristis pectinata]|uniref:cell death activator CIDE-3 n=1 Tax=Pristis pectinata TaxID=685728 RepID=UPI00223CD677|nr:cell death activator CIDE-3 [Pristis pectinata]XP_051874127.1 cell death activator CIDE-3 [Pristis pectinata]XP_051874128.1 cell death activator CIDE-3 [Pristis pectinata]XP_051874129.1 cell death activator CIDE-3 [Pristis pectinata]XP_051874130.1 cell death activator CIDE-3 [Pristis pectinata]